MSDAPERIWADPKTETTISGHQIGTYWNERHRFAKVEYVRADRISALEAEVARLREALEGPG